MTDEQLNEYDETVLNNAEELTAEFSGLLTLGGKDLPCYVLSNRKRVVTMREVVYLLTENRKGGLDRYTKANRIRDYMPSKFVDHPHRDVAILFRVGNYQAYGYEAKDIIDICNGYLKARQNIKDLNSAQLELARRAEIFISACATIGLEALIDEATGYQAFRAADELQVKLAAYIAKDLNEWTRTFPLEFFEQLYKLEGRHPPVPPQPYPKRFGRYVMEFVYDTLDPDVADWLRENNPNPEGEHHHHQWLTTEFGQPKLKYHLSQVVGIMKASATMERFKENLARAFIEARERRRTRLQSARREQRLEQDTENDEPHQLELFTIL